VPQQRALEVAAQAAEQLPLAHDDPRRWLLFTLQESYHAVIDRDAAWRADLDAMLALAEASGHADWLTEALNRRGRAQRELGQVADAEGTLRRAVAVACAAGLHHAEAAARINLSSVLDDGGAVADALAESVAAASAAVAAGDTSLRARAEFVHAYMLMRNGQVAEADALMTGLRASDTVQRNPMLAGRAARQLGIIKLASGAYTDAFALMREAVRRTHEVGDLHGIVISQTSLFYELVNFGLYDEARQLGDVTVALARRLGAQVQLGALLSSQAALHLHTGEPHEALPLARECVQIAKAHGLTEYVAASLKLVAHVELALGHLHAAQAAITRAVALMADITHPSVNVAPTAARVWLALGQVAQAKHAACEAVQRCVTEGLGSNSAVDDLWWAAEVLRETGEPQHGHAVLLQACERFLHSLAALDEPATRRAFLAKTAAHRALAAATLNTPRRLVHLPHRDAPTGRPLRPDELVPVVWTVQSADDPAETVALRHTQIQRMAAEALAQHAVATVEQLAATLAVSARTIKRDLHLMRQAGVVVLTRGGGTRQ
jgi:tetratricopeptide (TPR) repeat protein